MRTASLDGAGRELGLGWAGLVWVGLVKTVFGIDRTGVLSITGAGNGMSNNGKTGGHGTSLTLEGLFGVNGNGKIYTHTTS